MILYLIYARQVFFAIFLLFMWLNDTRNESGVTHNNLHEEKNKYLGR